ncbi:MAG: sulfotransferase [Aphanothece sp. CMT-3BRIN-NPC111]|jgi:hypothetical protein|nr:sulfotransferase [Aphanothece sp. CMT-3BRIN-NPC111]
MTETSNLNQTLEHPYRPQWLRLVNWAGSTLRRSGVPIANLSEESLLSAAQRQTKLSDWGDESFRVPLRILLASLEKEANLSFVGRYLLQQYLIRLLVNRLRIQDDLKRHPEILQVPIVKPLFVIGLPRTGTTFLHNLLSQDPSSRWLHLWELFSPSPPPDYQTRETDPRIQDAEKLVKRYNYLAPKFASAHYLNPKGPEECNNLFEHEFVSLLFEFRANIPSYTEWLAAHDMVAPYRYYRQQLQLLAWRYPGDHWALKAPAHLFSMDALLAVFPDACIVQTHRDPLKVLPSICSLNAMARGIYTDQVDLTGVGEHWLNRLANAIERAMQARDSADPARFYDVNYGALVQDPIGTVRQIYEYFGYNFNTQMEENINKWIAQNPQHKHGIHKYSLKQFGLDARVVNQRFARYRQRFNI